MLHMGDEAHNRNRAGTSLLLRQLLPGMIESGEPPSRVATAVRFIASNDHFFLNLAMPASKLAVDAARDVDGSTLVVAMARNGTDFGIQVSGTGDEWFTGPALVPEGLYLGGYGAGDANPDIGDSAITETVGLGGFAMAAAPAIVRFVGGSVRDATLTTQRMYEITLTENPAYALPVLDFRGAATGIDATRVVRTVGGARTLGLDARIAEFGDLRVFLDLGRSLMSVEGLHRAVFECSLGLGVGWRPGATARQPPISARTSQAYIEDFALVCRALRLLF
jgi:hypothetical protein